jgi:hypothetical protein
VVLRLEGQRPIKHSMLWFFERDAARLLYEIRRQSDGDDYELVLTFPDGRQEVEKYQDAPSLIERSQRLQETLRSQGWTPPTSARVGGPRSPSAAG